MGLPLSLLLFLCLSRTLVEGDDASLLKELEARASKLPVPDRYDSDPIFLQYVDSINEKSTYRDAVRKDQIYYERSASDKDRQAIALTSEEDKIQTEGDVKRVYVVLRQSVIEGKPKQYYPSLAFLVDPESGHSESDLISGPGGKKYALEWAVWNDGFLQGLTYSFQFFVCRYSILIPCKSDLNGTVIGGNSTTSSSVSAASFPPSDYMDFFRDLDNNQLFGRVQVIGMAFELLNGLVDGVGHLWCGIGGAITGQCHQYDAKNGYTKSQIGSPVMTEDGEVLASGAGQGFKSNGVLGTLINGAFSSNQQVPLSKLNSGPSLEELYAQQHPVTTETQTIFVPSPGGAPPGGGPPPNPNYPGLAYGRRKRDAGEAGSLRMKGWRTQYAKVVEPGVITKKEESGLYYGIGHCPVAPTPLKELYSNANSEEEVASVVIKLLRNDCVSRVKKVFPALKSENILEVRDKRIQLVKGNQLLSTGKLNWIEQQKLVGAVEYHAFTQTYKELSDKPEAPKNSLGQDISSSVKLLERMTLNYIIVSRDIASKHNIILLRHLVQVLRLLMDRLREEGRNLDECNGDCSKDRNVLNGDKFTVLALIKFIMHASPFKGDVPQISGALKDFIVKNEGAIQAALRESGV